MTTSHVGGDSEHAPRLRASAIGLKDAVVIGLASSGPTASLALTLAEYDGLIWPHRDGLKWPHLLV